LPEQGFGAQRASSRAQRRQSGIGLRLVSVSVILALLAIAAAPLARDAAPAQASSGAPKAVVIVGPTGSSTAHFLDVGKRIADQAQAAGMDVRRVFHPRATAERVLANIQGAKLVVYLGHGNGWPSPYAPFQEKTKNGFGLNAVEGGSASKHTYYGANWIRSNVNLAKHAVVMLVGACYSSGNGETSMPIPSEDVARQRVDNYAAGFLYAGASAVYAFGWQQKLDIPRELMSSDRTFDEIFMVRSNGSPSGFVGWRDRYHASQRTTGAQNHLDPHSTQGYYRAVSGYLGVRASQWRGGNGETAIAPVPSADTTPPTVPGSFSATAGSGLSVNLSWEPSTDDRSGTIRYRVVRNGSRIATIDKTSFTDKLSQAGTYRYKVRAVDAAGNLSSFTAEISVTLSSSSTASVGVSVPADLAAKALGYRRVELSWKASSSAVSGTIRYRIFRNGNRIATVTTLSYVDRPDSAGTYSYKVRAIDAAGNKSAFTPTVEGRAIKGPI
jgi:hypothetical protein